MAAYNSQSKRIKNALKLLLTNLTYDAGGGAEPAFAGVTDSNRNVFEGDPSAQVLPGDVTATRDTSYQYQKAATYIVRIRLQMENTVASMSAAYDHMYDLTDLVIDAVTHADQTSSLTDGLTPSIGTYMLEASRGDWMELDTSAGVELICDVNVTNTYSQTA